MPLLSQDQEIPCKDTLTKDILNKAVWSSLVVNETLSGTFPKIGYFPFLCITKTEVSTGNKIPGMPY